MINLYTYNILYILIAAFVVSFITTYLSIPTILKVSRVKQLFDEPGERSIHKHNIPTLGGLAIFAGLTVSSLIFFNVNQFPEIKYILSATIIVFFIGIKDDILVTAPLTKLGGQIIAVLIIIFLTNIRITNLHGFFGVFEISDYVGIPLTLFTTIVVINGFNLIDGIDGLSATIGVITSLSLGVWFCLIKQYQLSLLSLCLSGALIAFLRFNLFSKKDKIFMGDTGSLIIGLIVSVLIIKFNELNINNDFEYSKYGSPALSFAILIIPLFDTLRVMFIRISKLKHPFKPDKQHIHHVFIKLGVSHKLSVLILSFINILFIIAAFYFHNSCGIRRFILLTLLAAMIIFWIPDLIIRKKKQNEEKFDI